LAEASKQIINLGGLKEYTINEAAQVLSEVVGGTDIKYLPARHEVKDAWVSHEKAKMILKFDDSKTSLREGLEKMWEWAQKQPRRDQYLSKNYEVQKGIYDYWK